jgi:hypothetical protein
MEYVQISGAVRSLVSSWLTVLSEGVLTIDAETCLREWFPCMRKRTIIKLYRKTTLA